MKHCVITGAASGIGAALVTVFQQANYRVTAIDLQIPSHSTGKAHFIQADLSEASHLTDLATSLGSVDVLIHSAGISAVGAFAQLDIQAQYAVLDVNLQAPLLLSKACLPQLQAGGSIVFIASLSHYVSYPGASAYAASKDGLVAYARSLRLALKPQGIQVLTVFPGPTRTPHAARYSPDNRYEHRRMPPEVLAKRIYTSVQQRHKRLIPGLSNKVFALLGRYAPRLTEAIMVQTLYRKLS